jgi:hypothetical protein
VRLEHLIATWTLRIVATVFVATLSGGSCQCSPEPGGGEPGLRAPVREVDDLAGVTASMGTRVRVRGIAQNDKLSAVIHARGATVYCLDLEGWPADRVGKPAIIEGTIERTDQFAIRPSDGLTMQGTSGSILVIRRCTPVQ